MKFNKFNFRYAFVYSVYILYVLRSAYFYNAFLVLPTV